MRSHRTGHHVVQRSTAQGGTASPGKTTLVERCYGAVQASGVDQTTAREDQTHAAAKAGTAGSGGALPLDAIQRAFGRHSAQRVMA
jgi:hypothetical protein